MRNFHEGRDVIRQYIDPSSTSIYCITLRLKEQEISHNLLHYLE